MKIDHFKVKLIQNLPKLKNIIKTRTSIVNKEKLIISKKESLLFNKYFKIPSTRKIVTILENRQRNSLKNIKFFKSQIKYKVDFSITRNLKNTIIKIIEDIKIFKRGFNIILLSPSAASFDQFSNFEGRGDEFKRLCKYYARKFI